MGRKTGGNRLEDITYYVENHTCSKPIDIARGLDLHRSTGMRTLAVLDDAGILRSEDDRGRPSLLTERC